MRKFIYFIPLLLASCSNPHQIMVHKELVIKDTIPCDMCKIEDRISNQQILWTVSTYNKNNHTDSYLNTIKNTFDAKTVKVFILPSNKDLSPYVGDNINNYQSIQDFGKIAVVPLEEKGETLNLIADRRQKTLHIFMSMTKQIDTGIIYNNSLKDNLSLLVEDNDKVYIISPLVK